MVTFFGGCFLFVAGIVVTFRGLHMILRLLNLGFDIAENKLDKITDRD